MSASEYFGPVVSLPADHGVHQLVEDRVTAAPGDDAVVDEHGARLTYASLWHRSGVLAGSLAARGVRPGDRVGVALDRSIDLVVALLAVARAGAAYVPVDPSGPPARAAMVLSAAGCAVVLSGGLDEEGVSVDPPGPFDADTPLYVAYTSGSTGEPKGVVVPHRAVLALVTEPHYCPLGPGDRVAQLANPAFDATTFEVWSTLCAGATIVVLPPVAEIAIGGWGALLRDRRVSTMFLTTAVFDLVSRDESTAFASLDTLLFGGEAVDPAAVRRVLAAGPPRRLVNVYGPTETTTFASYFDCTPASLAGLERVPIGFPLQNTTLCVVDEELAVVPVGQAGELCVGGPGVALGYLDKPAATSQKFLAGPLYRTGDRVRQLPSGAIEFLGRADRQVKLRGFRVELGEVEAAVLATGLVTTAVVEKVGTGFLAGLVAFVVPAPGYSDASVTAVLRERLPGYLVPGRWVVLARLPLSGTGKIDRARLLADLDGPVVSSIQERLWFAEQAEPGTAAYTVPVLLRWQAVDPGALSAALAAVVARHETLRTGYRSRDGLPVPVAAEDVPFEVLEGEPDVAARVREPLDLARGPLWCTVWRDLVLLRVHHIAADGWSLGILLDDLADAYAGLTLAPPPLRYAEFAAGEHADPAPGLAGYPTELALQGAWGGTSRPAGVPRPGGAFPTAVAGPLWTEVREAARRLRTTPFTVLLSAFEVVVARWSGHDRFLLGTGLANRPRTELQEMVGPFANTVVLRCDVRPDASFASVCGLAGREILGALARPSVRFDRLVAEVGGRAPVVSVMFTYASAPPARRAETPWSCVTYPPTGAAKFDLMLHLSNDADGLAGVVEYDTDRYDAAFAAALAEGFRAVLAAAVAAPDRPVRELPLTVRPADEPPPGVLVADRVDLTARVLARLAANRREHTP